MTGNETVRVIDLISTASGHMKNRGFENARLEVERLLGNVLGLSRIELYLAFERLVNEEERTRFRSLYRRRLAHEPLQHILGTSNFHDITVKTDRRALIPRPETELLAETAIQLLIHLENPVFLDLGTGSGAIALSILNAVPEARGVAVDIDADALALAGENARLLGIENRISFVRGDIRNPVEGLGLFDVIVSNPPYVARGDIETLEPEVRNHEPRIALDGGPDGLDYFRAVTGYAHRLMKPGGVLLFECGEGQAARILEMLEAAGQYQCGEAIRDLAGRQRIVRARRRTE